MIELKATATKLTCLKPVDISCFVQNEVRVHVHLDRSWDGLTAYLTFKAGDVQKDCPYPYTGNYVPIPPELMVEENIGKIIQIGLAGYDGETTVRSLWCDAGRVFRGILYGASALPTPDMLQAIVRSNAETENAIREMTDGVHEEIDIVRQTGERLDAAVESAESSASAANAAKAAAAESAAAAAGSAAAVGAAEQAALAHRDAAEAAAAAALNAAGDANASAEAAAGSEEAAAGNAEAAADAANAAEKSAQAAEKAEEAAAQSAQNAEVAESAAQSAKTAAQTAEENAKSYAQDSYQNAERADGSAAAAAQSEESAMRAASSAAESGIEAGNSASQAITSAAAASESAASAEKTLAALKGMNWYGTIAEYNALPEIDPDVLYHILEGEFPV